MSKNIKSILDEMEELLPEKDKHSIVETRASHIISSTANLFKLIRENFSEEEAEEIQRRLLLSIKNEDSKKFEIGMKKLKEGKLPKKGK